MIGAIAAVGGVAAVREVTLLDSLYGAFDVFDKWVQVHTRVLTLLFELLVLLCSLCDSACTVHMCMCVLVRVWS